MKHYIFALILFIVKLSFASNENCRLVLLTETEREQQVLQKVQEWLAEDTKLGVPEEHQRRVQWSGRPGHATPFVATMIHGLYNSPAAVEPLADVFTNKSMNTMMARLPGHREANRNVLKKEIQWQSWQQQAESDFSLARLLGKKVILVGHSTGSLLSTWLAAKYPEHVAGLILFSPAFGVHTLAQIGAHFGKVTRINPVKPDGKLLSGHAGVEVAKAAQAFKHWQKEQADGDSEFLAKRLANIPIWMANTQNDIVIQKSEARQFMKLVQGQNPNHQVRQELWIPYSRLVLHDAITTEANPELPQIRNSLSEFLSGLEP